MVAMPQYNRIDSYEEGKLWNCQQLLDTCGAVPTLVPVLGASLSSRRPDFRACPGAYWLER